VLSVLSTTPAVAGDNIRLSIDGAIQQDAVAALQAGEVSDRHTYDPVTKRDFTAPAGAVVVEDPNNGTVIALATDPDYNPNEFVGGISDSNYAALTNPAADNPLLDRAISGLYNPGSTFKLVSATAGVKYGLISPSSTYDDKGGLTIGSGPTAQHFSNDNGQAYGVVNLQKAITVSSDAFFYNIGADLWDGRSLYGDNALQNVADAYGFGSSTGIDIPGEAAGYVLTQAEKAKLHAQYPTAYPYSLFTTGDDVQSAVGEDDVVVTPIQEADAYSAFANGGTLWTPRVALDAETTTGKVVATFASKSTNQIPIPAGDRSAMLNGFIGVTADPDGTAYAAFGQGKFPVAVAGKTGTAQVSSGIPATSAQYKQNTSVFASFAPADAPQYTVVAFVEQAGYGADVAAPIVKQVYEALFGLPSAPASVVPGGKD
jgi:penicillin-binding protein 2